MPIDERSAASIQGINNDLRRQRLRPQQSGGSPETTDLAGRVGAGALSMVAPSPAAEPGEAAFFVPGFAREAYSLADLASTSLGLGELPAAEHNRRMQQATREESRRQFGVEGGPPDTTAELIAEAGGAAGVPAGGFGRLKGAAKALGAGSKGQKAARAAEFIVPLNQARTAKGFAAETAVGTAIPVGVTEGLAAAGEIPQEQFASVLGSREQEQQQQLPGGTSEVLGPQEAIMGVNQELQQQRQQTEEPLDLAIEMNQDLLQQKSKEDNDIAKWIIGGAALLGLAAGTRTWWRRRQNAQRAQEQGARIGVTQDTLRGGQGQRPSQGELFPDLAPGRDDQNVPTDAGPNVTGTQETMGRVLDQQLGLRRMAKQDMTYEQQIQFEADLATKGTAAARSSRAQSMYETGISPLRLVERFGGGKQSYRLSRAPKRVVDAIRGSSKRGTIEQTLRMEDEIDNRSFAAAKVRQEKGLDDVGDPVRTQFVQLTKAELEDAVVRNKQDPEVKALTDDYHSVTRDWLGFMRARREISDTEFNTLMSAHPNYMPRMNVRRPQTLTERILGAEEPSVSEFDNKVLNNRVFRDVEPQNEPEFASPVDALEDYVKGQHGSMDVNDLLRDFFERSERYRKFTGRPPNMDNDEFIRVREPHGNGSRDVFYHVPDPFERQMFRFHAPIQQSLLNSYRRAFQMMNTGVGNPFFAPVGLMYDAMLIPMGLKKGEGFKSGLMPASIAERIPDVTAIPMAVTDGVWRGMWAQMQRGSARIMQTSIDNNGIIKSVMGRDRAQEYADRLANAWTNSTLFAAQNIGAISGNRFIDDDVIRYGEGLGTARANPGAIRNGFNLYKGFLDAIHNGARLQFFARNYRRGMSDAEINRLVQRTRNISGDFSVAGAADVGLQGRGLWQRGVGKTTKLFNENVPYGNVFIQATANQARMMRDNFGLWAQGVVATTMMPLLVTMFRAQEMGEEYVDHFWNELSWTDRLMDFHWYQEGKPPEEAIKMPMLPELAPFAGMVMGAFDGIMGWSNEQYKESMNDPQSFNGYMSRELQTNEVGLIQRALEGLGAGLGRTADPGLPPVVQAASLALTGQSVRTDFGGVVQGEKVLPFESRQLYSDFVPENNMFSNAVHSKWFEAITSQLMGAFGRNINEFVQAADRAYYGTEGNTDVALGEGFEALMDTGANTLPGASLLGVNPARTIYGERAEHLTQRTTAMKRIQEEFNQSIGESNVTRQDMPRPLGLNTAQGFDPTKQRIASAIAEFYNATSRVRADLDAKWEQINAINQRTDIPYGNKPRLRNARIAEMNDIREMYMEMIYDFEERIAQTYGMDQFRIDEFSLR